jgi:hypothetical protein
MRHKKLIQELTENLKLYRVDDDNDSDSLETDIDSDYELEDEFDDSEFDDSEFDDSSDSEIDGVVQKYVYKYLNDLLTNFDSIESKLDDNDDDFSDDEFSDDDFDGFGDDNTNIDDDDQYYEYDRKPLSLYKSDAFNSQYGQSNTDEPSYEEDEERITKFSRAEGMMGSLLQNKNLDRAGIIQRLESQLGITNSTAVSYYERILKKMGIHKDDENPMGGGDEKINDFSDIRDANAQAPNDQQDLGQMPEEEPEKPEIQEWDDPDRQGIIRYVKGAHLVYKRQTEEGTFNELWVYKINNMRDETDIRKRILSGTDITPHTTQSEDNSQTVVTKTFGNVQLLHITGLPN